MSTTQRIFEDDGVEQLADPDELPIEERKLITQPFDIGLKTLVSDIDDGRLHLRPLSDRPKFQRKYVWPPRLSSRLIESILLNVPIPPCYLAQDTDFILDVIDGQQRIYSIYRYLKNQFSLSGLEVLKEFNGLRFHELPGKTQKKLETHALRCVIITNDSHPEIRFDVFERLNTNTVPLNAQELRNSIYRGPLNDLLTELAENRDWLQILNRKSPDKRMKGEELILRFFAFQIGGLSSYRTPQKHWLNEIALQGRSFDDAKISKLRDLWLSSIEKSLVVFAHEECFRRLPLITGKRTVVNRALMDLTLFSMAKMKLEDVRHSRTRFRRNYEKLLRNEEFTDLITRAIDHKRRTKRRFALWKTNVTNAL